MQQPRPRILLLGCNGQLGWELQRRLAPFGELLRSERAAHSPWQADLAQPEQLVELVRRARPTVIVNAAAYTAVDRAEQEPERAHLINAKAPAILASAAAEQDALLVHFSTDYVFDGSGQHARDERAPTRPLNAYGRTKLLGEEAIRAVGCKHLIFRASWVYSMRGDNFVQKILKLAAERDSLQVVNDQVGAPTDATLLAEVVAQALPYVFAKPALTGTYHCAAAGQTSRYDLACYIIEHARQAGYPVQVKAKSILPIPSPSLPSAARRPLNSRLDCSHLQHTFGLTLEPWNVGIDRLLQALPIR